MLALTAEVGDIAVRSDLNKSFILRVDGATTLANWQELLSPVSVDQSIIDGSTNSVSGNAVFDALALKANLASPALTGTPTAPTATAGTNTTQLATTAFVTNGLSGKQNTISGTANYLTKFGSGGVVASQVFDNGTNVIVGTSLQSKIHRINNDLGELIAFRGSFFDAFGSGSKHDVVDLVYNDNNYSLITNSIVRYTLAKTTGNFLVNTTTDNGVDKLQVNGTISASPATLSNQVVVKSQLDAVGRPYKVYTALVSQTGTNAPVATVLENTLGGAVSFTYSNVGVYVVSMPLSISQSKTICFINSGVSNVNIMGCGYVNTTSIQIANRQPNGAYADGLMTNVNLEIRVYN
jgi:hypothetical protein